MRWKSGDEKRFRSVHLTRYRWKTKFFESGWEERWRNYTEILDRQQQQHQRAYQTKARKIEYWAEKCGMRILLKVAILLKFSICNRMFAIFFPPTVALCLSLSRSQESQLLDFCAIFVHSSVIVIDFNLVCLCTHSLILPCTKLYSKFALKHPAALHISHCHNFQYSVQVNT